eukprot:scaffold169131_cov31-Tisochrysis_lutea.AAC.1
MAEARSNLSHTASTHSQSHFFLVSYEDTTTKGPMSYPEMEEGENTMKKERENEMEEEEELERGMEQDLSTLFENLAFM